MRPGDKGGGSSTCAGELAGMADGPAGREGGGGFGACLKRGCSSGGSNKFPQTR